MVSIVCLTAHFTQVEICKTGLWGGNGGFPCDIKVEPYHLENVTICSGAVIDSLAFSFRDQSQHQHTVGPWGGNGGDITTVCFFLYISLIIIVT